LWEESFKLDSWTKKSAILDHSCFENLGGKFKENIALRGDYERRQALLEIDVISSIVLGLSLENLITIYNVHFPVMRQYEGETFYDTNGSIIFTPSKSLLEVGLARKANRNDSPLTIEYPNGKVEIKPLGWEDIAPKANGKPSIPDGTKIHRMVIDDTLPGGPQEKIITYVAPFYLPNREEDYRVAWKVFTERFKDKENHE